MKKKPAIKPDPRPLPEVMFDIGVTALPKPKPPLNPPNVDTSNWDRDYLTEYYNRPGGYSGD